MDVLGRWMVAFADLRDGRKPRCPACDAEDLGWCTEGRAGEIGFGAVWCKRCGRGTWISRLEVREGDVRCADAAIPTFEDVST